jgi:AraC-like DNA-binding protein
LTFSTAMSAKKSTPPLLRYAHLMAFESFLRQSGAPVGHYLHRNGLPTFCEDPNAFLPLLKIWSFFDDVARHEDADIGWLVSSHVGDKTLNANLLREIESAPTLLSGMNRLIQKVRTEATDIDIGIQKRRNDYLFYMHYPGMSGVDGYMVSQAYQIGIFIGMIRHFLGQNWIPDQIGIESPFVPPILESYFPGCQILTKQPAGYIAVPISCAHQSTHGLDTKTGNIENPLLPQKSVVKNRNLSYVDSLRAVLKSYLSDGYISERVAAELMGTSVRTLTRKLHGHHTTYGRLIDEVRFDVTKKQLQKSSMQIGQVARHVGFKDQGDFSRMIRRVSGLSPTKLRGSLRDRDGKT